MKLTTLFVTTAGMLVATLSGANATEADPRLVMPGDIKPEQITAQERNPFERRVELKSEDDLAAGVELSEEDRVRQRFNNLEVRGGTAGVRVLLSDMILEKGKLVAPVLAEQTIQLVVSELTADEIVLTWVDDIGKKRPRTIVVPYDLTPRVASLLSGQTNLEKGDDRVMMEQIMTRAARPEMPKFKATGADGKVHEIDTGAVAGQ